MDIQATKLELIKRLLSVEKESVLEELKKILLSNTNKEETVGYTTDGQSLTLEDYQQKVQRGINDIKSGNYTLDEDFAREIETW
ncbi:hypothetical protein [Avrilella dinanensis]|uniref:Addiction module protein n=1 Tax=Avrilella dinanensis TaxID=2008672 RepID=A0A2M9R391_9FLAO|nr:hypothetical protein [Avrilella dinanensis]PJR03336.1 hypothetical protein CDL10_01580 [Avrilella dinanensis]